MIVVMKVLVAVFALLHLTTAAMLHIEHHPSLDLHKLINEHPEHTHFLLQKGEFSATRPIHLKRGHVLEGVHGTTINQAVVINQEDTQLINLNINSANSDCTTITKPTNISKVNIGPCTGRGIFISQTSHVNIYDSYIHPEHPVTGCCDSADAIYIQNSNTIKIQGNVIAYGETNIEMAGSSSITILGNFFLNPLGPFPRGQQVQAWSNCSNISVLNNYAISSNDTTKYKFKATQEDAINFGVTNGVTASGNWVTGGQSSSGCGMIADAMANNIHFVGNVLYLTGQCGIGIANGVGQVLDSNIIYNTPLPNGGNTAIYVWQQYSSSPCSNVQLKNNIAYATNSQGQANSYWNGGGCNPVTTQNNTFDSAAKSLLTPFLQKYPPPSQIPPVPFSCTAVSPYSNANKVRSC